MPALLVDVLSAAALVCLLAVAFVRPPDWVEASAGLAAAALVVVIGAVSVSGAERQVSALLPVVGFLSVVLLVAQLCRAEGVFGAVGALLAGAAGGRGTRLLTLTFVAAAAVTAVLSLDATVVLLTPVAAVAAAGAGLSRRPVVHACARLANSASLLLPVANLTNLLAMPRLDLSFVGFASVMAPVWLAVLAVEYVGHRAYFRADLRGGPSDAPAPERVALPRVPVVVVGLMLVGFAVASPLGVEPVWVAAVAAGVLTTYAVRRRRIGPGEVARALQLPFAVFVLGLGVVVAALAQGFLGRWVAAAVPSGTAYVDLLAIAVLATALANVVNNLPATLLLLPLVAPLGTPAVLAALVGLDVGSGLTYPGSLANLLWRRTLAAEGRPPSARDVHLLALLVTPPALLLGVAVLSVRT